MTFVWFCSYSFHPSLLCSPTWETYLAAHLNGCPYFLAASSQWRGPAGDGSRRDKWGQWGHSVLFPSSLPGGHPGPTVCQQAQVSEQLSPQDFPCPGFLKALCPQLCHEWWWWPLIIKCLLTIIRFPFSLSASLSVSLAFSGVMNDDSDNEIYMEREKFI